MSHKKANTAPRRAICVRNYRRSHFLMARGRSIMALASFASSSVYRAARSRVQVGGIIRDPGQHRPSQLPNAVRTWRLPWRRDEQVAPAARPRHWHGLRRISRLLRPLVAAALLVGVRSSNECGGMPSQRVRRACSTAQEDAIIQLSAKGSCYHWCMTRPHSPFRLRVSGANLSEAVNSRVQPGRVAVHATRPL